MKVAGIQLDIAWEDPEENFRRAGALAREAAATGARMVVLPEMFSTGFTMDLAVAGSASQKAERFLADLAKELALCAVGGVADAGGSAGLGRNFALAYGPDGTELCRYQKIHPFSYGGEAEKYDGGTRIENFSLGGVRVTPLVCYDLRFPELFRAAAEGTDLFLVLANWPEVRRHAWRTLLQARAMDAQCFVLGVNRWGEGGGLRYAGDSLLVDPSGDILSEAPEGQSLLFGEVSSARVAEIRGRFPFLRDRKPTLYGRLAK